MKMDNKLIEMAIAAMDAEIAEMPTAQLLKERGRLRMMVGDHEGAMADLKEAVKMEPQLLQELSGMFKN